MPIFAKKTMNVNDWSKVQDQIEALVISLGGPHDLMMLSAPSEDVSKQKIYIGLPRAGYLGGIPWF